MLLVYKQLLKYYPLPLCIVVNVQIPCNFIWAQPIITRTKLHNFHVLRINRFIRPDCAKEKSCKFSVKKNEYYLSWLGFSTAVRLLAIIIKACYFPSKIFAAQRSSCGPIILPQKSSCDWNRMQRISCGSQNAIERNWIAFCNLPLNVARFAEAKGRSNSCTCLTCIMFGMYIVWLR